MVVSQVETTIILKVLTLWCGLLMTSQIAPKCKDNSILIFTVTGVLGGCILGFLLRAAELGPDGRDLVSFPGDIFFRLLKLLTFPLIVSSLITG